METIWKIDGKKETGLFIKLKNDGKDAVRFYDYDSNVTQGAKQYEAERSRNAGKELPSEMLLGI